MHSLKAIYDKKFKILDFTGIWQKVIGSPEEKGSWLIFGPEKHGKTQIALQLADYLSTFGSALYISGEEGLSKPFVDACLRARISPDNRKLKFLTYTPLEELYPIFSKRQSARFILFDNLTVYADEFKYGKFRKLLQDYPDKLFIFIAHEENKQPYTSAGKMSKKLAQIIIQVEGLRATVSGRCPGGLLYIDEAKAKLYWGEPETTNS